MNNVITYRMAAETCCEDELKSWVTRFAPGRTELTYDEIFNIVMSPESTSEDRANVVIYLTDLPVEMRMEIAKTCDPFEKGRIVVYSDLPIRFRGQLVPEVSEFWTPRITKMAHLFREDAEG